MPHSVRRVLVLLPLLALLAPALAADPPPLTLDLGQAATGAISFPGEEDHIRFEAVEGTVITATAKLAKGSLLAPGVGVLDPAGNPVSVTGLVKIGKKSAALKKFVTTSSGVWTLIVTGTGGTTGEYTLKTKGKAPKKLPKEQKEIGGAPAVNETRFFALPGTLLTAKLKGASGFEPRILRLLGPDGGEVAIPVTSRKTKGAADSFKKLPLPDFGEYVLEVGSETATGGGYKLTVSMKAPKPLKTTWEFRGGSGGTDGGDLESIRIHASDFTPAAGETRALVAIGTFADGRDRDVTVAATFTSGRASVATVSNADGSRGLLTAGPSGGSILRAAVASVESRGSLLLVGGETVTGVTILPAGVTVAKGETAGLTARVDLAGGGSLDGTYVATWASDNGSRAEVGEDGTVSGVSAGSANVTAAAAGLTSSPVAVTVTAPRLVAIRISPKTAAVDVGSDRSFSATGVYSDGSTASVTGAATWESDWLAAATVSGGTADGLADGAVGIRARLDGIVSGAALLLVGDVTVDSVTVSPASATAAVGSEAAYTAAASFSDGSDRDVTAAANWSTANGAVATAEDGGRVTGVDAGESTTVSAAVSGQSDSSTVNVTNAEITAIRIVPTDPGLDGGDGIDLRAFAMLSDGTDTEVTATATWSSSNPGNATVSGGRVSAGSLGASGIAAAKDGVTSPVTLVTTSHAAVSAVAIGSPTEASVGTPADLTAVATMTAGPNVDVTSRAGWSTADPASLPIDGGTVRPLAETTTNVIAAFGGFATTPYAFTGQAPEAVSLAVFPQTARAPLGLSFTFGAQLTTTDGRVEDVAATATWSSTIEIRATVSAGVVTTLDEGQTVITASVPGVTPDTSTFTVEAPILLSIAVTPADPILEEGATRQLLATGTLSDGLETNLTSSATWRSSATGIATVSATGLLTAGTKGFATITAEATNAAGDLIVSPDLSVEVEKAPVVTSLTGTTILMPGQSTTGLKINGANFLASSTVSFGADVDVTVQSITSTVITVDVSVDGGASVGSRTVTVTLPGAKSHISGSLVSGFNILGTAPVVSSVNRSTVDRGVATNVTVTGANFDVGTPGNMNVILSRSGTGVGDVAIGTITVTGATSLTVSVTPTAVAVFGDLDLTVTHAINGTSNTLADAFAVTQPTPTIGSLNPTTGAVGGNDQTVEITGTNFMDGDTVEFSGSGITVDSVTFSSSTRLIVLFDVDINAAKTARDVTVTHPVAAGEKSVTSVAAFTVTSPPPTIASVSPDNVDRNATKTVTLTGTNLTDGTISISPSTGLTISSQTFSGTSASFSLAVGGSATIERRDVTVTRNDGKSVTLVDGIKIGPPDPQIDDVTPAKVLPGQTRVLFTVTGEYFESGNTTVSFSGTDLTVASGTLTVSGTTGLTFEADVKSGATIGAVDLTVSLTGKGSRTEDDAVVIAPADPFLLAIDLESLSQGASSIAVIVTGSNFRSGDTLSTSGTGITFSSVTVVDGGKITATVAATASATKSLRDLIVTHSASDGGGQDTLTDAFEVIGATPSVTSVSPAKLGATGTGGATRTFPVSITGTDFMTGATLAVTKSGKTGLTVGSVSVVSKTLITAQISVTGAASVSTWDVKVTNPGSLGDSGTSGNDALATVANTTLNLNSVVPSSGLSHGGNEVTLYGSGFAAGAVVDFGTNRGYGAQVIDANTLVVTVPEPTTTSTTATTGVDVKVTNPSGSPSTSTLTNGYGYEKDETLFTVKSVVPAQGATGVATNLKACVFVMSEAAKASSLAANKFNWFESGWYILAGLSVGTGPNQNLLVLKTTSTSLPKNGSGDYVMEIQTGVTDRSGTALTPVRLSASGTRDQYKWTIGTTGDTTAPTATFSPTGSSEATTTEFVVTFSEPVDPSTITTSTVTLKQGTTAVGFHMALAADLKTLTVIPHTELQTGKSYTIALTAGVKDLSANAISATSQSITTASGSDTTAPVIDAVIIEGLPSSMDGSGKYNVTSSTTADYDLYLPQSGFRILVRYSDEGGAGIDETSLTVTSSVKVGSTNAGSALASNFTASPLEASWRIPDTSEVTAGSNVEFKIRIKDTAGNQSAEAKIVVDIVDADTNSSNGDDLDPFDSRQTWVLRFDRDKYTTTVGYDGTAGQVTVTTTGSSDGTPDFRQALEIVGMQSDMSGTNAKTVTNGNSVGTNAIVERLVTEAIRERLRERFSIDTDGTRDADSVDIEFLLPGEQGSLSSLPTYSTTESGNSSKGFSEMDIGGDTQPNSDSTGSYGTVGRAYYDERNRDDEANLNEASTTFSNLGIFVINQLKGSVNESATGLFRSIFDTFIGGRSGTPVGKGSDDATVLSGTFDRTSGSNTTAQNDRYDAIMDAIDALAMSISSITAHEMGHSLGLVPNDAPPKGLFGNADDANAFTEGGNTSHHLDYLGNDIMAPSSSFDDRLLTGTDYQRFSPYDQNYLRNRQVYDEAK